MFKIRYIRRGKRRWNIFDWTIWMAETVYESRQDAKAAAFTATAIVNRYNRDENLSAQIMDVSHD